VKIETDLGMSKTPEGKAFAELYEDWVNKHYVAFMLLTIPFWTIGSYLAFKKQKYNFIEHFTLNTYIAVQGLVVQFLLFPLTMYFQNKSTQPAFIAASGLLYLLIATWTYAQFFNNLPKFKTILYSILAYVIMTLILTIVGVGVGFIYALLMKA
jgi:hypothetical protein